MAKPCAVFWDIQNIDVPKGQSVDSIVNLIRSTIIKPFNLKEIFFFCVSDVHKFPANFGHSLTALNVAIVQAYNGVKDSADNVIMDLMRKFVAVAGQDCTIILLSGDANYYCTLSDLKKLHNVSIHLITSADSLSPELDHTCISDYIFMLDDGVLKPIKSTGLPMYFISIKNYPLSIKINQVVNELNAKAIGSIGNSAILYKDLICIRFPNLLNAEKAIEQLNGWRFHEHSLKAELIVDSPLTEILKFIKPNVTMQTKNNNEAKQLTFIKINNSNETGNSKIINFCIACTIQSGSQCILSRKPFLWIVFSLKSDAQDCLSKVQIMYPDAIISEPPVDLTLTCNENPYTVESCEQKVTVEVSSDSGADNSNIAIVKPERAVQVNQQKQSSSIARAADTPLTNNVSSNIELLASKVSVTTSVEPKNNLDVDDDNERKMFFRCDNYSLSRVLDCKPTKWSLLYNLFEKLYDLGAKKVIFDGNLYCAHFDSVSAYQDAFEKRHDRYLEPLEFLNASKTRKHELKRKMDRYITGIPWCFNQELDLCCLTATIESKLHEEFMEISRNILGNHECIFIKSVAEDIWIGFPDELMCKNSEKTLLKLSLDLVNPPKTYFSMAKPSNELLESINFHDLVGAAYDLAFLSSQLEGSESIYRPNIIERISLQRMEVKECNDAAFHITVTGNFNNRMDWNLLQPSQMVKIFVNFSKVIPLAATASYGKVNLIYNSWHEAHNARHFIKKLTTDEVPYLREFRGASLVHQQPSAYSDIAEYYIINDKRRVLEKIINRLYNTATVQSTSNISSISDEQWIESKECSKFAISAEYKFTSGMISIIKMNLVQMACPVCIEFEDVIWVAVGDFEKRNYAKSRIGQIKFKMLHENDEYDFDVGILTRIVTEFPPLVVKMLAFKLRKSIKTSAKNTFADAVPLGHFNYNYRKAVGMSTSRYYKLTGLV